MRRMIFTTVALAMVSQHVFAVNAVDVGDTYTQANSPSVTSGTAPTLLVSSSPVNRAWIQFNLQNVLPTGTPWTQVSKATLKLWVTSVSGTGNISVYAVTGNAWSELTLADNIAPAVSGTDNGPILISSASQGNFVTLDLTALVQEWIEGLPGGANNYGIVLAPSASSAVNVAFDSKESTTTSHEPQLDIVLNSGTISASLVSGLSAVATSGSYASLSGLPTIPTNTTQLTNGAGYVTSSGTVAYALSASNPFNQLLNTTNSPTFGSSISIGTTTGSAAWINNDGSASFAKNSIYFKPGSLTANNASLLSSNYHVSMVCLNDGSSPSLDIYGNRMFNLLFLGGGFQAANSLGLILQTWPDYGYAGIAGTRIGSSASPILVNSQLFIKSGPPLSISTSADLWTYEGVVFANNKFIVDSNGNATGVSFSGLGAGLTGQAQYLTSGTALSLTGSARVIGGLVVTGTNVGGTIVTSGSNLALVPQQGDLSMGSFTAGPKPQ